MGCFPGFYLFQGPVFQANLSFLGSCFPSYFICFRELFFKLICLFQGAVFRANLSVNKINSETGELTVTMQWYKVGICNYVHKCFNISMLDGHAKINMMNVYKRRRSVRKDVKTLCVQWCLVGLYVLGL